LLPAKLLNKGGKDEKEKRMKGWEERNQKKAQKGIVQLLFGPTNSKILGNLHYSLPFFLFEIL